MNAAPESKAAARIPPSRTLLLWARRGLWIYALGAALYLNWRFDIQTLPANGSSPLERFRPGAHLLVDTRSSRTEEGAALLFHDDLGRLLLGRVASPPASETRPGLWILSDLSDTSLPDSRTLGPIPHERVAGRVMFALPSMD